MVEALFGAMVSSDHSGCPWRFTFICWPAASTERYTGVMESGLAFGRPGMTPLCNATYPRSLSRRFHTPRSGRPMKALSHLKYVMPFLIPGLAVALAPLPAASASLVRIYVTNEETSSLDVYDRKTGKLTKKVPLSDRPNNIAVTKNGDRIAIAVARGKGRLHIVDAATLPPPKTH